MTIPANSYTDGKNSVPAPGLDLGLGDDFNLRLLRSEFARMMGVSKPTVTEWVKAGWVAVGADGRIDPRQAVASLLRHRDPARIRSKVLAPLIADIAGRDREIERLRQLVDTLRQKADDLRRQLAIANEGADFEYESAIGLATAHADLLRRLRIDWPDLAALPGMQGPDAIQAWLSEALEGSIADTSVLDYATALGEMEEGGEADDAAA